MAVRSAVQSNHFVGRLFSDSGRLHLVLDVDRDSATARVSYQDETGHQVVRMPVAEVSQRLNESPDLKLDGLNATRTTNRVLERDDGWFFTTREGDQGPFPEKSDASAALKKHVIATQQVRLA